MDNNNEVISFSQNDSISMASTAAKSQNGNMSSEEMLLQHLQKGISEKTEEDIASTREIIALLSKLDLDLKTLPNDIKESLEKLSLILKSGKLYEFDEVLLRVIKERKVITERRQQREEKRMSLLYDKLFSGCTRLQTKTNKLESEVNSLKNRVDSFEKDKDNLYCNKIFLSSKLQEYQQTVEKLEAELNVIQANELLPEEILKKYKLYLEDKGRLEILNQLINQYADLPPNLLQAKVLLESKRKEYENLEQLFFEKTN